MKNDLSITIITLNEEENIKKCLESVVEISDDIVLVDSGSVDRTVKIAKRYGARIFTRAFENYADQKNFALSCAKGKWVLSVDADEQIPESLAREIKKAIEKDDFNAYSIPRRNIIFGKFIKYTRWQPELDRHVWLWKKGSGKWVGAVHEEVEVEGPVGRLKNPKVHHQYKTVKEFFEMMDSYSELDARKFIKGKRCKRPSLYVKMLTLPVYHFLVRYFYRLGILDGWRGFVLSYLMSIYQLNVLVKVYENLEKN